jgi:hypothetical protein
MADEITVDDVRALAAAKNIPLSEAQIAQVRGAAQALRDSAARLRAGLRRNDEPAFGYRHSAALTRTAIGETK